MRLLRTLAVTFALYSRIPMPHFEWKEEDMRYSIAAFPIVGAVIGLVFFGVSVCASRFAIPDAAAALLLAAVPLIITGGFHADGFMDVADALSSFRTREEKLEILKDPHIGAFAVIRFAVCGLIYIASLIIVLASENAGILGLSGLAVLTFRSAKKEGMLYYESTSAAGGRTANIIAVCLLAAASVFVMVYFAWPAGGIMMSAAVFSFCWYKYMSYKEFGGITGDTAGYFVVVCETAVAAAAALAAIIMQQ